MSTELFPIAAGSARRPPPCRRALSAAGLFLPNSVPAHSPASGPLFSVERLSMRPSAKTGASKIVRPALPGAVVSLCAAKRLTILATTIDMSSIRMPSLMSKWR